MMPQIKAKKMEFLDRASWLTLIITLILFALAAYLHGWTTDLLLEAGVFLVSMKLMIGLHKIEVMLESQNDMKREILEQLGRIRNSAGR